MYIKMNIKREESTCVKEEVTVTDPNLEYSDFPAQNDYRGQVFSFLKRNYLLLKRNYPSFRQNKRAMPLHKIGTLQ